MENLATNSTTPSDPPRMWVPEPTQRGTFGIISLCLSTMIIGSWDNPYLYMIMGRSLNTRRIIAEVTRTVLAFCAPELLLSLAANELSSASTLLKIVRKVHPSLVKPGMFARMYQRICRPKNVSTLCHYMIQ